MSFTFQKVLSFLRYSNFSSMFLSASFLQCWSLISLKEKLIEVYDIIPPEPKQKVVNKWLNILKSKYSLILKLLPIHEAL